MPAGDVVMNLTMWVDVNAENVDALRASEIAAWCCCACVAVLGGVAPTAVVYGGGVLPSMDRRAIVAFLA